MVLRENTQGVLEPIHVKGHQDDIMDELSLPAQMNVRMDVQAKKYIQCTNQEVSTGKT